MRQTLTWVAITTLALVQMAGGSKILALMNVPSHSHHFWNSVYIKALADRGHEVTYLGVDPYPNKPANVRHIYVGGAYELYVGMNFSQIANNSPYESIVELDEWEDLIAENMVKREEFKKFIDVIKSEKFDLVVYDLGATLFLLGAVDLIGKPPVIGITPFSIPPWTFDMTGTPYPIQNNQHFFYDGKFEPTLLERFENLVLFLFGAGYRSWVHVRNQDAISKKAFGPGVRHIADITSELNIAMVNANWATDRPFPTAPGLIPVGGLHIAPVRPLPEDLKKYLDSATAGVIYFSLGSNIQSNFLEEKKIDILNAAFKQLAPIKVLWKWESDTLPGKPDNVKTAKWLPQNDILAHPNVRLFFTHGGLLSTQEALFHGKPMVGLPIFLDQHVNIKKAANRGIGEALRMEHLSPDYIVKAIRKVWDNPSYSKKAAEMSSIFRDQQNSPLDTAVFWTEYAIRHGGGAHLLPASTTLSWIENGLYDFFLVASIIVCVILFIAFKIIAFVIQFYLNSRNKSKND